MDAKQEDLKNTLSGYTTEMRARLKLDYISLIRYFQTNVPIFLLFVSKSYV